MQQLFASKMHHTMTQGSNVAVSQYPHVNQSKLTVNEDEPNTMQNLFQTQNINDAGSNQVNVSQYPVDASQHPVNVSQYPVNVTQYPVNQSQVPNKNMVMSHNPQVNQSGIKNSTVPQPNFGQSQQSSTTKKGGNEVLQEVGNVGTNQPVMKSNAKMGHSQQQEMDENCQG